MTSILKVLSKFEDGLLVFLLAALIGLASTQILLRNLFDTGLVWIDPLLRVMVLWLGLLGASVAAREHKHIQIDLLTRLLNKKMRLLVQSAVDQFSAWVCLLVAWFGLHWIQLDYADDLESFIQVPAWMLEIIIPISFMIIGARYLIQSVKGFMTYLSYQPSCEQADR